MKVQTVNVEYITQIWSGVAPYIERALQYTDDYNADQVKVFLTTGAWLLLVAVDDLQQIHGVATVAFENRPNFRVAFITTIGGKGIVNQDCFTQMARILRSVGATKIQGYARDSLVKLYERYAFSKKSNLVEIKL
jgi:hypothetical protein